MSQFQSAPPLALVLTDLFGPPPGSKSGNQIILVMMNRFLTLTKATPVTKKANIVANIFLLD